MPRGVDDESDPENVERRFGIKEAKARKEQRQQRAAERARRVDVAEEPLGRPTSTPPMTRPPAEGVPASRDQRPAPPPPATDPTNDGEDNDDEGAQ